MFKWIVVRVLKNKLGYRRSWQTFFSAESDISSCVSRDGTANSIVAPELDYRRLWFKWEKKYIIL